MASNGQYPRPGDVDETFARHYSPSPTPQSLHPHSPQPPSIYERGGAGTQISTYAPQPRHANQTPTFSSATTAYSTPYQNPTSYTPVGNPYRSATPDDTHYEMGTVGYRSANSIPPAEYYADNVPLKGSVDMHRQPPASPYGKTNFDGENTAYGVGGPYHPQSKIPSKPKGFLGKVASKKIPWFVYLVTLIQVCVFIAELIEGGKSNQSFFFSSRRKLFLSHSHTYRFTLQARRELLFRRNPSSTP